MYMSYRWVSFWWSHVTATHTKSVTWPCNIKALHVMSQRDNTMHIRQCAYQITIMLIQSCVIRDMITESQFVPRDIRTWMTNPRLWITSRTLVITNHYSVLPIEDNLHRRDFHIFMMMLLDLINCMCFFGQQIIRIHYFLVGKKLKIS